SDQAGANLGSHVATAGDVNGDGFSDVLVGAWRFDDAFVDEGRAFLFLGSPTGLATTPAWTADGEQLGALLGSVASAGDVNGDGFGDVIVGAEGFTSGESAEGRVSLFLGSASGLSLVPARTLESDQSEAAFGRALAMAGDVNGDGFGDVIVGVPGLDDPYVTFDSGGASVFLGNE